MRKIVAIFLVIVILFLSLLLGCADSKKINGKIYEPYGIANSWKSDPNIQYQIVLGNVIWGILLAETIIFPVWVVGWSIYEPVQMK